MLSNTKLFSQSYYLHKKSVTKCIKSENVLIEQNKSQICNRFNLKIVS